MQNITIKGRNFDLSPLPSAAGADTELEVWEFKSFSPYGTVKVELLKLGMLDEQVVFFLQVESCERLVHSSKFLPIGSQLNIVLFQQRSIHGASIHVPQGITSV